MHGKKKFIIALQPDGSRRLRRSRGRTRADRVAAVVHYRKPVGVTYGYRRTSDGLYSVVRRNACQACLVLVASRYGRLGTSRECETCERVWDIRLSASASVYGSVPRYFRKLYEASYRQYERTMATRLLAAYRAGLEQEDDPERLEYEAVIRDAAYDYW